MKLAIVRDNDSVIATDSLQKPGRSTGESNACHVEEALSASRVLAITMTETQQVIEEVRVDLDEAVRLFSDNKYEDAAELLGDSLEVL